MIVPKLNEKKLTENFDLVEFHCKCSVNHRTVYQMELVKVLQENRTRLNRPIYILSGHRCPKHNAKEGGKKNSKHIYGWAVDIYCKGMSGKELMTKLKGFDYMYHQITTVHVQLNR